jgi:hypothetical protein
MTKLMFDVASPLQTFLDTIGKDSTPQEQLFLTAGLIELLRRTKNRTHVLAMAELLVESADEPWQSIPFSLTKTLLSSEYKSLVTAAGVSADRVPQTLLVALQLFLCQGGEVSEPALREAVETVCETMTGADTGGHSPAAEEPPPKKDRAPGVEVFNANLLRRGFAPQPLTAELAKQLGVRLVTYRAPLPQDRLSPTLRAIAFPAGEAAHALLLETGEYVIVANDAAHLEFTETPADFKAVSPVLLANVVAAHERLQALGLLSEQASTHIATGCLGKITKMHFQGEYDGLEDLQPLTEVFSGSRPSGMLRGSRTAQNVVYVPVMGTNMFIGLFAALDDTGPYGTARIVQDRTDAEPGRVLIRHDTPRQITPQGVYLFPTSECFVSFTAIFDTP